MTNNQIIITAAIAAELYTEEEALAIIAECGCLPLHTYQTWRRMGYQVKRGEKSALVVDLWRWNEKHNTITAKTTTGEETEMDCNESHHYKQRAYLFTVDQVEKVAQVHRKTPEEIKAYNAMLAAQRAARKAA